MNRTLRTLLVAAAGVGVAVTGGWTVDTVANPSPWSNSAATKNKVTTTTSAIDMSSATIPSATNAAIASSSVRKWSELRMIPAAGASPRWTGTW